MARARLHILDVMIGTDDSDVIHEVRDVAELALKGMQGPAGEAPPRRPDVGAMLRAHAARFTAEDSYEIDRLASPSAWWRKECVSGTCPDIDVVSTESCDTDIVSRPIDKANVVVECQGRIIGMPEV